LNFLPPSKSAERRRRTLMNILQAASLVSSVSQSVFRKSLQDPEPSRWCFGWCKQGKSKNRFSDHRISSSSWAVQVGHPGKSWPVEQTCFL